ncbi:MAG: hypothetical protein GY756_11125 [bacterium]|nr:hypothetical protein [bacterium]
MENRVIIIDGPSTVGKSSISKAVYEGLKDNYKTNWLHEECENHPIRSNEFTDGDLNSLEGMESNYHAMIAKWVEFVHNIENTDEIYVVEGCLLHQLDRYLLQSVWTINEIRNYYQHVLNILQPLNPIVIFLYRPDIRGSFEKAFTQRGDWWKKQILREPEPVGYFAENKYKNDDSIFQLLTYEQEQMNNIFGLLHCKKLKLDTTNEKWNEYRNEILQFLGVQFDFNNNICTMDSTLEICGKYQYEDSDDIWEIKWDANKMQYYSTLFWPYMPMKLISNKRLGFVSFPIELFFSIDDTKTIFTVKGNYDWDYNDKIFKKLMV